MPLKVNSIPHQLERFIFWLFFFRQFESERPISTASLEATDPDCRTQKKKKEKTFPKSSASLSTRINFPCHMPAAALPHVGGELVFVPRSLECVVAKQGQIR